MIKLKNKLFLTSFLGLLTNCIMFDSSGETDPVISTNSSNGNSENGSSNPTSTSLLDDLSTTNNPITTEVSESNTSVVSSTTLVSNSFVSNITTESINDSSTGDGFTTGIENNCGNFIIDKNEQCDDGSLGSDKCTNNCTISFCGDEIINSLANEECDDGNFEDKDYCSAECIIPRLIFLTSDYLYPDFGGVLKADEYCQTEADKFNVKGMFKAWISDSNPNNAPVTRFFSTNFNGWYILSGLPEDPSIFVTKGWLGLQQPLMSRLNRMIDGTEDLETTLIWSNTKINGEMSNNNNCSNWTVKQDPFSGEIGNPQSLIGWTDSGQEICASRSGVKIYCFQVE